jgi:hypothetical protein
MSRKGSTTNGRNSCDEVKSREGILPHHEQARRNKEHIEKTAFELTVWAICDQINKLWTTKEEEGALE